MWEDLLSPPERVAPPPPSSSTCSASSANLEGAKANKRKADAMENVYEHPTTWKDRLQSLELVQALLKRLSRPVRVHTACSGTGAPVVALGVSSLAHHPNARRDCNSSRLKVDV